MFVERFACAVSATLQLDPNSNPMDDWRSACAFIQLPDGRLFFGDREDGDLALLSSSGFGGFSTQSVEVDSGRSDTQLAIAVDLG